MGMGRGVECREAGWQTGGITSAVPAATTATKATTRIAATQVYRVVKLTKCLEALNS